MKLWFRILTKFWDKTDFKVFINQTVNHLISQFFNQTIIKSINKSINWSINQSFNWLIKRAQSGDSSLYLFETICFQFLLWLLLSWQGVWLFFGSIRLCDSEWYDNDPILYCSLCEVYETAINYYLVCKKIFFLQEQNR